MIHPVAWLVWLGAILTTLSLTRNPFYLSILLLEIAVVGKFTRTTAVAPIPLSPFRFALVVLPVSALFNALTVHFGDTVLFSLPDFLPLLGGAITLEALVYGFLNGIVISALLAGFTVVNQALPVRALIRLIPRAFYPVAVVTSIALTFMPVMLRQFEQIREAQAARGHRLVGLRDWLPLLLPLLIGGLERAMQLAEAMTARGFAGSDRPAGETGVRLALIGGLILLLTGWLLRLVWQQPAAGLMILLAGISLILMTLWLVGRRLPRTVYRPEPWQRQDWGVAIGAALVILFFLVPTPLFDHRIIFYYPYPALTVPSFDLGLALATLGLLGPILRPARWLDPSEIPSPRSRDVTCYVSTPNRD